MEEMGKSHSENVSVSHVQREWGSSPVQRVGKQICTVCSGQQSYAERIGQQSYMEVWDSSHMQRG